MLIKKLALITIIFLLLGFIVWSLFNLYTAVLLALSNSPQADTGLTKVTVYLFFMRLTGVMALVFIGITMVTGALRPILISFYKSASFWELHTKWTSSVGIGMALSHLAIFLLYQNRLGLGLNLKIFVPVFGKLTLENNLIFFGLLALILLTFNTLLTHVPGVTGKKWWRPLHILNYLALLLILWHAYFKGTDSPRPAFRFLYYSFLALTTIGAVYRMFRVVLKKRDSKPKVTSGRAVTTDQQVVKNEIADSGQKKEELPDLAS